MGKIYIINFIRTMFIFLLVLAQCCFGQEISIVCGDALAPYTIFGKSGILDIKSVAVFMSIYENLIEENADGLFLKKILIQKFGAGDFNSIISRINFEAIQLDKNNKEVLIPFSDNMLIHIASKNMSKHILEIPKGAKLIEEGESAEYIIRIVLKISDTTKSSKPSIFGRPSMTGEELYNAIFSDAPDDLLGPVDALRTMLAHKDDIVKFSALRLFKNFPEDIKILFLNILLDNFENNKNLEARVAAGKALFDLQIRADRDFINTQLRMGYRDILDAIIYAIDSEDRRPGSERVEAAVLMSKFCIVSEKLIDALEYIMRNHPSYSGETENQGDAESCIEAVAIYALGELQVQDEAQERRILSIVERYLLGPSCSYMVCPAAIRAYAKISSRGSGNPKIGEVEIVRTFLKNARNAKNHDTEFNIKIAFSALRLKDKAAIDALLEASESDIYIKYREYMKEALAYSKADNTGGVAIDDEMFRRFSFLYTKFGDVEASIKKLQPEIDAHIDEISSLIRTNLAKFETSSSKVRSDGSAGESVITDMAIIQEGIMQQIHGLNINLVSAVPNSKTLWHVIPEDLIPYDIRTQFIALVTKMNKVKQIHEKIRVVTRKRFERHALSDIVKDLTSDPNNIVDVAARRQEDLIGLPEGVKALVFAGELGDFRQLEGVIAALRAIQQNNVEALVSLYRLLTGSSFSGNAANILKNIEDPIALSCYIRFNLQPVKRLLAEDLRRLNESLLKMLQSA